MSPRTLKKTMKRAQHMMASESESELILEGNDMGPRDAEDSPSVSLQVSEMPLEADAILATLKGQRHHQRIFAASDDEDSDEAPDTMSDSYAKATAKNISKNREFSTVQISGSSFHVPTDQEDSDDEDEYDEDLMGDAVDRAMLMKLSEIEREEILYERSKQREQREERRNLKRRLAQLQNLPERKSIKTERIKSSHDLVSEKSSPLAQVKKSVKETLQEHTINKESIEKFRRNNFEDEESGEESESIASSSKQAISKPTPKKSAEKSEKWSLEQIHQVQIKRQELEDWMDRSWFTTDHFQGYYLRLCIGKNPQTAQRDYRMVKLEQVQEGSSMYTMPGGKSTRMTVLVSIGNSKKCVRLDGFSDQPVNSHEFYRYEMELSAASQSMPICSLTFPILKEKLEEKRKSAITNEEIQFILKRKAKWNTLYVNPTVYLTNLYQQLDEAREKGEDAVIEEISQKILEWEQKTQANYNPSHGNNVAYTAPSSHQTTTKKTTSVYTKDARLMKNAQSDPFARRKTRSTFATAIMAHQSMNLPNTSNNDTNTTEILPDDRQITDEKANITILPLETKESTEKTLDDLDLDISLPDFVSSKLSSSQSKLQTLQKNSDSIYNVLDQIKNRT